MSSSTTLDRILNGRVVGIIRLREPAPFQPIVRAFADGGLHCLEITMNTPGAVEGIRAVARDCPEVTIGAGTVLDITMAKQAIDAGAQFLVTPTMNVDVILLARRQGIVVVPGALTPSEVHAAWCAGADIVKVFPASLGGAAYIRSLKGPFPEIRLAPTGGVSVENAAQFLDHGADIVCVGGWLVPESDVHRREFSVLTQRAVQLMAAADSSRKGRA
jgi:2-dehydro-3-deoxyphosphogluconate aldolase / (4S)-4-hydroxy-2-oxoglutarate aldolase